MSFWFKYSTLVTTVTSALHRVGVTLLMADRCSQTQFWDSLVKSCLPCELTCKQHTVHSKCTKFCLMSECNSLSDHYYDGLLKKCVRCAEVCRGQPRECPRQCIKSTPLAVSRRMSTKPSPQSPASPGPSALTTLDTSILLYTLLAISILLLLSSLGLASRVFLKRAKSKSRLKHDQNEPNKENGLPLRTIEELQLRGPTEHEPSPTETCVCVHCFPDLKGLGQDCPIRGSHSKQRSQGQNGGHVWNERDIYTSGGDGQMV